MINYIRSFVRDLHTTVCDEETFSSRFSSDSEVNASESLENLEEMFPLYRRFKSSTAQFLESTRNERERHEQI